MLEIRDIGWDGDGVAAHGSNFLGDSFGFGLVGWDIVYADVVTVAGETEGDGFAAVEVRSIRSCDILRALHSTC